MANADSPVPKFKAYAEGEPIPPVDPEDLRRRWEIPIPRTREAIEAAWQLEADISAVSSRDGMIRMLSHYNRGQLLAPWNQGEELHEAVFRIAATFPLRYLKPKSYMIAGDEHFGFDPNAFVQRLMEETDISHVWEPIATKVPEGGRLFISLDGPQRLDPDTMAKREARELAWEIWKRFSPNLDQLIAHSDKEQAAHIVATFFADFLMDNIDLVRQLKAACNEPQSIPLDPILSELERRAQGRV